MVAWSEERRCKEHYQRALHRASSPLQLTRTHYWHPPIGSAAEMSELFLSEMNTQRNEQQSQDSQSTRPCGTTMQQFVMKQFETAMCPQSSVVRRHVIEKWQNEEKSGGSKDGQETFAFSSSKSHSWSARPVLTNCSAKRE